MALEVQVLPSISFIDVSFIFIIFFSEARPRFGGDR